jgi:putative methyltransferase
MSMVYQTAAKILDQFLKRRGGIKTLCYAPGVTNCKAVYALVCETLKFKDVLEALMAATKDFSSNRDVKGLRPTLRLLLVYELVLGKGKIQGGGAVKKVLLRYQNALKTSLVRAKIKAGVADNDELLPDYLRNLVSVPRYVRINRLKMTMRATVAFFEKRGYTLIDSPDGAAAAVATADGDATAAAVSHGDGERAAALTTTTLPTAETPATVPSEKEFWIDAHVCDLLAFAPNTDLHDCKLVDNGALILQDKASCFPAYILAANDGGDVIDACAAPGNKTSHVASIMHAAATDKKLSNSTATTTTTGTVFAFEINDTRCKLLRRRMAKAGADCIVSVHNQSFLDADPYDERFANVTACLLDPTCSGSGMVQRVDHILHQKALAADEDEAAQGSKGNGGNGKRGGGGSGDGSVADANDDDEQEAPTLSSKEKEEERIKDLAVFQTKIITHALRFPAVRRVTYSTCSVHAEENEAVVAAILAAHPDVSVATALPTWPRRGAAFDALLKGHTDRLVRALPELDRTNGFFVALFVRSAAPAATNRQPRGKKRKEPPVAAVGDDTIDAGGDGVVSSAMASAVALPLSKSQKKRAAKKRAKLRAASAGGD